MSDALTIAPMTVAELRTALGRYDDGDLVFVYCRDGGVPLAEVTTSDRGWVTLVGADL